MNSIDWVGRWYLVARERGRSDYVDFGRVPAGGGSPEWFDYAHADGDGVYGMRKIQTALGRAAPPAPFGKEKSPPGFPAKLKILFRAARAKAPPAMRWRDPAPGAHATPKDFAWRVFSAAETAQILAAARAEKVSINAWLLARLNDEALPTLLESPAAGRWLFPVNMRGPLAPSAVGNQSSGIVLHARPGLRAREIHEEIRTTLRNGGHWATWWMLHVGKLVGLRGMRILSKRSEEKSFWLGSFTNLGEWDAPEAPAGEAWLVAPPGSPNYPIGVGIVTWAGKMSIVFKVHPSVCRNRETPGQIFQRFTARVLNDAGAAVLGEAGLAKASTGVHVHGLDGPSGSP